VNARNRKIRDYQPEMHPKKVAQRRLDGHSREWDRSTLGRDEAHYLRHVWGPFAPHYVTGNSDN